MLNSRMESTQPASSTKLENSKKRKILLMTKFIQYNKQKYWLKRIIREMKQTRKRKLSNKESSNSENNSYN